MEELTNLLTKLNEVDHISPKEKETGLEKASRRITKYLLFLSAGAFLILLAFFVWDKIWSLSHFWRRTAVIIGLATIALSLMYLLIDLAINLISILKFKIHSFRWLLLEVAHDKKNIDNFICFKKETLEEAQQWLQLKNTRIRNRIGVFIGNPEKLAVFSLASFGWLVWREISEKIPANKLSSANGDIGYNLLIFGVAFLAGIAFAAVLMNEQLRRYTYQLELIAIALKKKP